METVYHAHGVQFVAGHVIPVWEALAAQGVRVQTVVTSPPYWGARAYGTEPQVWGGDPLCAHEYLPTTRVRTIGGGQRGGSSDGAVRRAAPPPGNPSYTCRRCGAWVGELGGEPTLDQYLANLVAVFRAVRQAMRPDATLWLNLGDCYSQDGKWGGASGRKNRHSAEGGYDRARKGKRTGLGAKQMIGAPWRVVFALQADGWVLRKAIPWIKRNALPDSAQDRPGTSLEYIFVLAPRPRYYFDMLAVRQHLALQRDWRDSDLLIHEGEVLVFDMAPSKYEGAHYATFPPALAEACIRAGSSTRGACATCGAPWKRLVRRTFVPQPDVSAARGVKGAPGQKPMASENRRDGVARGTTVRTTAGWAPTCACAPGEPVPCLVGDPFLGTGTSAAVAYALGRHFIGGDLQPAYLEQAVARMDGVIPRHECPQPEPEAQLQGLPLFVGAALGGDL